MVNDDTPTVDGISGNSAYIIVGIKDWIIPNDAKQKGEVRWGRGIGNGVRGGG
jgi:hypothetical protein